MKFSREELKILNPEGSSWSPGADNLERCLVEKDLKVLVDVKLSFSQQCALSTEKSWAAWKGVMTTG